MKKNKDIIWPTDVSDEFKKALLKKGKYRFGVESIKLTSYRQIPKGIYYISSGVISLGILNESVDSELAVLFSKGDWLFSEYYFHPSKLFLIANEIEQVEFVYFSFSELKSADLDTKDLYKLLLATSSKAQSLILQRFNNIVLPKEMRVAYALVDLYYRIKNNSTDDKFSGMINISQSELSVIANLSRPKLNLELKKLELEGVISISRNRIKILDIEIINKRLNYNYLSFHAPLGFH